MNMDVTITKTNKFLCRICALTGFTISIFSDEGKELELQNKITFCLGIKVLENDNLPKRICYECLGKLSYSYDFKKMFELAQANITRIFDDKKPDKPVQNGISNDDIINLSDNDDNDDGNEGNEGNGLGNVIIESIQSFASVTSTTPSVTIRKTPSPESNTAQGEKRKLEEPAEEKEVKKKERTTICVVCANWIPRTQIAKHEETVHFKKELSCSKCNIDFETFALWTEHAQKLHVSS